MPTDIYGRRMDVLCYIEGYLIPIKSVNISTQLGAPSVASISIPPITMSRDLMFSTHVVLFYRLSRSSDNNSLRDQYKLMFHGEVTSVKESRNGINMSYQINIVDSRTYMNRMPGKMLYSISESASEFFPNYLDDADFYGVPTTDAIKAYLTDNNVLMEKTGYTLKAYVDKIMSMFSYDGDVFRYYHNAAMRYLLVKNHHIIDYGDNFKKLWGAYYKTSLLRNAIEGMASHQGTTMDSLVSNMRPMGYMYTSTTFPYFKGDCLAEYFIMRDLLNHRIPRFNYVLIDRDDNFDALIAAPPITALKYKYKLSNSVYPVDNYVYPKDAMKGDTLSLTNEEKIYGINRQSVDMEYFYNAFMKDAAEDIGGSYYNGRERKDALGEKIQYDFIVKQTSRSTLSFAKVGLYPNLVLGFPAAVYDPLTGRLYRGTINRISYSISMDGGNSVTTAEAQNVILLADHTDLDKDRKDVNPCGSAGFKRNEASFYEQYFYGRGSDIHLTSDVIGALSLNDYYKYVERPTCSMREYMKLYYDVPDDATGIPDDLLAAYEGESKDVKNRGVCMKSMVTNSDMTIERDPVNIGGKMRMNSLFIGDRRDVAYEMQQKLREVLIHEQR